MFGGVGLEMLIEVGVVLRGVVFGGVGLEMLLEVRVVVFVDVGLVMVGF